LLLRARRCRRGAAAVPLACGGRVRHRGRAAAPLRRRGAQREARAPAAERRRRLLRGRRRAHREPPRACGPWPTRDPPPERGFPAVGVVVGVDGGNSKTDVLVARTDGAPLAYLRGSGSNAHGPGGAAACIDVIDAIVERASLAQPAVRGAFFLCGADVPSDFDALAAGLRAK